MEVTPGNPNAEFVTQDIADQDHAADKPRVCLVTDCNPFDFGIEHPDLGSLGFFLHLSKLRQIELTLLYCGNPASIHVSNVRSVLAARYGCIFLVLCEPERAYRSDQIIRAWFIYDRLKNLRNEIIVVVGTLSLAYYCIVAKQLHLEFADTKIITVATRIRQLVDNDYLPAGPEDLARDFSERYSVEHSDALITTSQHLIALAAAAGWAVPETSSAAHGLELDWIRYQERSTRFRFLSPGLSFPDTEPQKIILLTQIEDDQEADSNAFVEMLEQFFEEKLDAILKLGLPHVVIAGFKKGVCLPSTYIKLSAVLSRFAIPWLATRELSVPLLRSLAACGTVIQFSWRNVPSYLLLRVADEGIVPLCRTEVNSAALEELNLPSALSLPKNIDDVADKVLAVMQPRLSVPLEGLREGAVKTWNEISTAETPRPPAKAEQQRNGPGTGSKRGQAEARPRSGVEVSVCMPTYNRGTELLEAVASLEAQSFRNFEIILVDDGSTSAQAIETQQRIVATSKIPCRRFEQHNQGPSAARNLAAGQAAGDFLLFMDDDNIAVPGAIDTFLRCARLSEADILTCVAGIHPGSEWGLEGSIPANYQRQPDAMCRIWGPPLGACIPVGLYYNCFGDTNCFTRKRSYFQVGGFNAFMYEDLEFFMRATIAGCKLLPVPEILYLYRFHSGSRSRRESIRGACLESLKPALDAINPLFHPLLYVARSKMLREAVAAERSATRTSQWHDSTGLAEVGAALRADGFEFQAAAIEQLMRR